MCPDMSADESGLLISSSHKGKYTGILGHKKHTRRLWMKETEHTVQSTDLRHRLLFLTVWIDLRVK